MLIYNGTKSVFLANMFDQKMTDLLTDKANLSAGQHYFGIYNCENNPKLGIPVEYQIIAPEEFYVSSTETNSITLVVAEHSSCDTSILPLETPEGEGSIGEQTP